jgi:hypothetical protein
VDAKDRLVGARGWVRTDGLPFADTVADLLAGQVYYPPRLDEFGNAVDPLTQVAAGTESDGTGWADLMCDDWTGTATGDAQIGMAYGGSGIWTNWGSHACSVSSNLYCFGTDHAKAVEIEPQSGRIAFVSLSAFLPGKGIESADALCRTEAANASLAGTFKALVATDSATAASRFSGRGPTWVRPDGIPIASTADDFLSGGLPIASISLTADAQSYMSNYGVWSGFNAVNELPGADMTCDDWAATTSDRHGRGGRSGTTSPYFVGQDSNQCDATWIHIYCLEE